MKKVAVVILNWNGLKLMSEYLPSVYRNTPSEMADVVVADNGSDDGSVQWVRQHFPQVRIIAFDRNYGYAEGYNRALSMLDEEYVVLLNSDVETPENWLEPMVAFMDKHSDIAACQPKLHAVRNKNYFEYAGAAGGYIDRLGYPFCRGRIFDTVEEDNGQYDTVTDIFWATGACLFIRREIYIEAGGLDPFFFAHMEEIDLCWRIHLLGKRIVTVPDSIVYHLGGATLDTSNPRKTYLNFRNNLLMLHKNLPVKEGRKLLFTRRLWDTAAMLMFLLKGEWKNVKAIWKAHCDFRQDRKKYTRHPQKNLLRVFPQTNRNITIDYFLKRKKVY
ncbi:glycosyltransferase family 2 protein [Coprobacter tertius]|uniref:Glycosyltransferase family 2 protein n=1 Tax=Coprobacter tertius TaxID=2944915 RepID=A0ABT1MKJ2_9BACT|nr:glycosyltransferase family 2 protein [Coprobacter tertius]MCP9612534.1 glycosyltransferase family 2 protein [Coprobacter tertius]